MKSKNVIELLREKGFKRQAALLESSVKDLYAEALYNYRWAKRVKKAFGDKIYKQFERESVKKDKSSRASRLLYALLNPYFRRRTYKTTPLEITIESNFDISALKKAADITGELIGLSNEPYKLIYDEAKELTKDNSDLLFEIYKDNDITVQLKDKSDSDISGYYSERLSAWLERTKKYINLEYPEPALLSALTHIIDLLPPTYTPQNKITKKENVKTVISEAEKTLSNNELLNTNAKLWLQKMENTKRERVSTEGKSDIFDDYYSDKGYDNPLSTGEIETLFMYHDLEYKGGYLEELLSSPLNIRKNFLESDYMPSLERYHSLLQGIQHILMGGPITNPNASEVSVLQNHHGFPNLKYSDRTKERLNEMAEKLKYSLGQLPDISDIATPTKLLKRRNLTYVMRELPKDPLDVAFGNDSACCIFVPENPEELQNGLSVPVYLIDNAVRLFSLYRVENDKEQRMGLVLAFETYSNNDPENKILSCNSLELSRFGISGGNDTIRKITNYAEDWLIGYAQKHGYKGVTMGSHSYNTSVNFSSRISDVVSEDNIFSGLSKWFYSDIFAYEKEKPLRTRENSCYWLWGKPGLAPIS